MLKANSSDDQLLIEFTYFSKEIGYGISWHFMHIVSLENNLHEISNPIFLENKGNISNFVCLKYFKVSSADEMAHHYENTPIQIYRKFYLQKLKIFR